MNYVISVFYKMKVHLEKQEYSLTYKVFMYKIRHNYSFLDKDWCTVFW